jgi:hypothetical protein
LSVLTVINYETLNKCVNAQSAQVARVKMAAHNEARGSALIYEGLNMKKLIATIFFTVLAVGSMYGCVVDDGHRGDGRRGGEMNHPGDGPRDRMERDDHRDQKDDHRDPGDQRRDDH